MISERKVVCDNEDGCKKEFLLNKEIIAETKIVVNDEECEMVYFECPHCGSLYIIEVEDKETKELKQKINAINKKLSRKRRSNEKLENYNKKYDKLIKERQTLRWNLVFKQRGLHKSVHLGLKTRNQSTWDVKQGEK